jgi:CIC family chloride channel protein
LLAQSMLEKQFIFLSSVLVGISSAFAVIVLKSFAHQVFSFATYINGILKLSFINSLLPIAGLVLTVFVVKSSWRFHRQRNFPNFIFGCKKASIVPKKCMPK